MTTALLLIDAQDSFTQRPYWRADALPAFLERIEALVHGCGEAGIPIVRILHVEGPESPANPFSHASGRVRPLDGLCDFQAAATFEKSRHSALVGTGLPVWLREHGTRRLIVAGIRTEQCCETTTRHASDEGFTVDFVSEATLTFDMHTLDGERLAARDIVRRTEAVLQGRFATVCSVDQALARAQAAVAA